MTTYEWKDPTPASRGRGIKLVSDEIVEILQSRPNEWLFVGHHIRTTWLRSVENHYKGKIEMTSRNNKHPKADIYLRWVA